MLAGGSISNIDCWVRQIRNIGPKKLLETLKMTKNAKTVQNSLGKVFFCQQKRATNKNLAKAKTSLLELLVTIYIQGLLGLWMYGEQIFV